MKKGILMMVIFLASVSQVYGVPLEQKEAKCKLEDCICVKGSCKKEQCGCMGKICSRCQCECRKQNCGKKECGCVKES